MKKIIYLIHRGNYRGAIEVTEVIQSYRLTSTSVTTSVAKSLILSLNSAASTHYAHERRTWRSNSSLCQPQNLKIR